MSDVLFLSFYSKSGTVTLKMQTTTSRHSTDLSVNKKPHIGVRFFLSKPSFLFRGFCDEILWFR